MTQVFLTEEINRNLCNALNPQIRNQENQPQETGKKALTCSQSLKLLEASAVPEEWKEIIKSPIDAFSVKMLCFLIIWFCM